MKKIPAFKCDHCEKLLSSYSGMYKHEKKCFKNPCSKSCITCHSLGWCNVINDEPISEHEENILQYKIEGTYMVCCDPYDETLYNVLKDDYKYLYDCELIRYCNASKQVLRKLKTQCELHTDLNLTTNNQ